MTAFFALIKQDMRLSLRVGGGALLSSFFFFSLIAILPFAIGPDLPLLARIGSAIIWFAALLSLLLGLDRLFSADYEDGSLDLLLSSDLAIELMVLAKMIAHWLTNSLPLILLTPLLGFMLNLPIIQIFALCLTLLIGTPALTALATIGAALTFRLAKGGILLPILILPMTLPILIFGVSATTGILRGQEFFMQPLLFLSGVSLLFCVIAPIASAYSLRLGK